MTLLGAASLFILLLFIIFHFFNGRVVTTCEEQFRPRFLLNTKISQWTSLREALTYILKVFVVVHIF